MTKQHRATPEQWAQQALWVETYEDSSCIMELLHRIEILEATQHAHIDTLRLSDEERDQIRQELARPARVFTAAEVAPIVVPNSSASLTSPPAGSLIDRVADAIGAADDEGLTNMTWSNHSRAAILEVAAWMVEQAPEPGPVGKWLGQISTPFAVMADILRDEANR